MRDFGATHALAAPLQSPGASGRGGMPSSRADTLASMPNRIKSETARPVGTPRATATEEANSNRSASIPSVVLTVSLRGSEQIRLKTIGRINASTPRLRCSILSYKRGNRGFFQDIAIHRKKEMKEVTGIIDHRILLNGRIDPEEMQCSP